MLSPLSLARNIPAVPISRLVIFYGGRAEAERRMGTSNFAEFAPYE